MIRIWNAHDVSWYIMIYHGLMATWQMIIHHFSWGNLHSKRLCWRDSGGTRTTFEDFLRNARGERSKQNRKVPGLGRSVQQDWNGAQKLRGGWQEKHVPQALHGVWSCGFHMIPGDPPRTEEANKFLHRKHRNLGIRQHHQLSSKGVPQKIGLYPVPIIHLAVS